MREISVTTEKVRGALRGKIDANLLDRLTRLVGTDIPKIVYTSFDGDFLSHAELMKQVALKNGLIPMNPESALGTYLVVNHYKGEKAPIIEDCFALLAKCDVFWVISRVVPDRDGRFIAYMPEGVAAETLYWMNNVSGSITLIDIDDLNKTYPFINSKNLIGFLSPGQKEGVQKILKKNKSELKKTAYLVAGEKHAKHSDWMRQTAYQNKTVPLCPYTLINFGTLTLAFGDDSFKKILARTAIALKADELWIFTPFKERDFSLEKLDADLLTELLSVLSLQPEKRIFVVGFDEAGVPKFTDKGKWAFTEYERRLGED